MTWRNNPARYGWLTIGLHWLMLALLVALYLCMELREFYPKGSAVREAMKTWHYLLGICVLILACVRLAVYLSGPVPAISPPPARWQALAATTMKAALYLFMLGMPLLGWMILSAKGAPIVLFAFELPPLINQNKAWASALKELHEAGATAGYLLVAAHAIAALYHHYVLRDDTLRRMLPP